MYSVTATYASGHGNELMFQVPDGASVDFIQGCVDRTLERLTKIAAKIEGMKL